MKKTTLILTILCFLAVISINAQKKYEPSWESLDSRETPKWFEDAKFGVFIHWGPYSVPAWTPKGTYTEWYQHWLQEKKLFGNGKFKGTEVYDYHTETYGEDFTYYDFGEMFIADQFNADQWAKLFEDAGARYMVITTKHHDGFCLWPSEEANKTWGFPWNSVDVGAKRDLLKELELAIKKTDIKFGTYYSLYEWYNPLWLTDKNKYVTQHMIPQFKDMVSNYRPELIFSDGDWDMEAEKWKSQELLAWLFNEGPNQETMVINDRWGKGIRFKYGGYFSPEYAAELESDRPWEECRGIGLSFSYNKNEDSWDYATSRALIYLLINIVSNGGNLLLGIAPDMYGDIPPIMQDRLLDMGKWLKVNEEAIYGTRKWERPCQWSEVGEKNWKPEGTHYLPADFIVKQTVNPEPGYAVREMFFTQKDGSIYVIVPKWPKGEFLIRDFKIEKNSKIILLGSAIDITYRQKGKDLIVKLPYLTVDELPCEYAWTFKISK